MNLKNNLESKTCTRILIRKRSDLKRLLYVHLHRSGDIDMYISDFNKMIDHCGTVRFIPTWSWFALLGPLYFSYRKITDGLFSCILLAAICFYLLEYSYRFESGNLAKFITAVVLIFSILFPPVTARYFYIKKFCKDLNASGYGKEKQHNVESYMYRHGGINLTYLFIISVALFAAYRLNMF